MCSRGMACWRGLRSSSVRWSPTGSFRPPSGAMGSATRSSRNLPASTERQKTSRRRILSLRKSFAALALSLVALANLPARAAEPIAIGEPSWTSAVVVGHVLGHVIHDRLGYDVTYVTGNPASLLAAISKGDGAVDIEPEIWLPNASGLWAKYIGANSNKTVLANDHPYVGEQGLYIPGY